MSLPIKIDLGNGECRRLEPAAADGGPTYSSLVQPCQGWCPALRGYKLVLQYQDDENDWISISSDHELETAQNMAVGQERKTLKLQAQGHEVGPIGLISEEDAGTLATSVGLSLGGGGVAYAGNYTIKGLYTYSDGQYKDMVFFGQGGTEAQRLAPLHADSKQRVDDMLAEMRARAEAHAAGLTAGTAEFPFAGDDYATKGLYTYSDGRFQGAAFYGRGGTVGERGAPVDTKQRVGGIGPRQPKHRKWARPRPPAAGGRAAAHHQMSPAAGGWDPMEPGNMAIGVSECGTVATKAATSPDTWTGLIGTTAMSRGCNYWEVEILASGQPAKPEFFFGVAKQGLAMGSAAGAYNSPGTWLYYPVNNGEKYNGAKLGQFGRQAAVGDRVGIELDFGGGGGDDDVQGAAFATLSFWVNGLKQGTAFATIPNDGSYMPCAVMRYRGDSLRMSSDDSRD